MAALLVIVLAWTYIVVLMAAAEAFGPGGSVLGAVFTFFGYGVLPIGVVLYVGTSGLRRRARDRRAQAEAAADGPAAEDASSVPADPGRGGHAAGAALAPEREEP